MADDCLFCKLISGEIPTNKVYEDDICFAFDDIEPEAPRAHAARAKEALRRHVRRRAEEVFGHMMSVVPKVAEIKGVRESGFRTVVNTGPDSATTVKPFHIHILGGVKMGRFTFENSQRAQGEE